jgi:hypothetical protein
MTPSCGGQTMSISVDLTVQEVAALKRLTKLENDADAVTKAAREFLRLSRLRELKAVSGKVEFEDNWQELEQLELGECGFPA